MFLGKPLARSIGQILLLSIMVGVFALLYEAGFELLFTPGYNPFDPLNFRLLIGTNFAFGIVLNLVLVAIVTLMKTNELFWFLVFQFLLAAASITIYTANHDLTIQRTAVDLMDLGHMDKFVQVGVSVVYLVFFKHIWSIVLVGPVIWWLHVKLAKLDFANPFAQ